MNIYNNSFQKSCIFIISSSKKLNIYLGTGPHPRGCESCRIKYHQDRGLGHSDTTEGKQTGTNTKQETS